MLRCRATAWPRSTLERSIPWRLDAWIAERGLSLGEAQRLNLARALLSPAPVILLDEPAEHLGDDQAARILTRLLARWRDRIVVLTSHRPGLRLPGRRIALGPE